MAFGRIISVHRTIPNYVAIIPGIFNFWKDQGSIKIRYTKKLFYMQKLDCWKSTKHINFSFVLNNFFLFLKTIALLGAVSLVIPLPIILNMLRYLIDTFKIVSFHFEKNECLWDPGLVSTAWNINNVVVFLAPEPWHAPLLSKKSAWNRSRNV